MHKQGSNFIFTINNPKLTLDEQLDTLRHAKFTYARIQLEKGESGTVHMQGMCGGKRLRFSQLTKLLPQAHIEIAKSAFLSWEYCGKADTRVEGPVEFGTPPAQLNKRGEKAKRNAMLIAKGAEQAVKDGDIGINDYSKLKHNIDLYNATTAELADLTDLDNEWIYGPPGVGKSRGARQANPEHYDKPLNKWWDDYKQQPAVILDDFGKDHSILGSHLKRWADHYPFTAEVKGGATKLRPKRIIVTSNYHPDDIWSEEQMREAIKRRFKITNIQN